MGSWNQTCAITDLPIRSGEEVAVFFLLNNRFNERANHCYWNTYYNLLPFHFYGKYDDYGGVQNCHGDFKDYLIDSIRDKLVEMPLGPNKYHDVEISREKLNDTTIFEYDHEHRLNVYGDCFELEKDPNASRLLTHIQIKKSVLDQMLKTFRVSVYRKKNGYQDKMFSYEMMVQADLEDITLSKVEQGRGYISRMKEVLPDKEEDEYTYGFLLSNNSDDFLYWCRRRFFLEQHIIYHEKYIYDHVHTQEDLEKYIRHVLISEMIIYMFQGARKPLIKPVGSGSQSDTVYMQKLFASLTNYGAKAFQAARKKEREEYEREYGKD